jgi:hypothetical protein
MAGHVTFMGEMRKAYKMSENLKGRNHLKDLGIEGKIILKWSLNRV